MILQQHYLACLAQASYLIVDEASGTAAVVDPRRDVGLYLEEAERLGATIRHVVLTHFHADFLAGHLELAARTGATIHLGARARAEYAFHPLREGDVIALGRTRLEVLETPGHTPEGISLVVHDPDAPGAPAAVLTGDALFVGDVGRPDLLASSGAATAEELAGMLYDSLRTKLMALPDDTVVYPAHGAGSMCGKSLGSENSSTIGAQKRTNWALQPMEKDEFVRTLCADQPAAPRYFAFDAQQNKRDRKTLDDVLAGSARALPLDEVLALANAGAQVLDARTSQEFAAGHLVGSVNVGLDGKYASWAGTLLEPERTLVLVAPPGKEVEAVLRLGRIGYDRVAGYLDGGAAAWSGRDELVRSTERLTPAALAGRAAVPEAPVVVDVRTPSEREEGAIAGSLHLPLNRLPSELTELPRDRALVLVCRSGYRSSAAASFLRAHGFPDVSDLEGGMLAWNEGDAATTS